MKLLITGGAGYIGSHVTSQLLKLGHDITVIDNLYSGHRWALPPDIDFYEGCVGDPNLLETVFSKNKFDTILHFAAHTEVEESIQNPAKYYTNNTSNTINLIKAALQFKVNNFIFSSTAAVYGNTNLTSVSENDALNPINPYGNSKLMSERIIQDAAVSNPDFKFVILRYFNVAGASIDNSLGQSTPRATHLIKVACETACLKRDSIKVMGSDYSTPDGTCIRDFIHVEDLAQAHVLSVDYLKSGNKSEIFNCGYERGYSVKEVIESVKKVSGVNFKVDFVGRRSGDAEKVVANSEKIKKTLNWSPKYNDLETICKTAFLWEKKNFL